MKTNTIKWKIFKSNLLIIVFLIALTTLVFNFSIRLYMENDITKQLNTIAMRAEETVLHRGPDFFSHQEGKEPPPPPNISNATPSKETDLISFYFMLDRSLREPLSLLKADYLLLDDNNQIITTPDEAYFKPSEDILEIVISDIEKTAGSNNPHYMNFSLSGTEYIAIIQPVSSKNSFGLGWIVTYSSLQKLNELQLGINVILLIILLIAAIITAFFSSLVAKKISAPFSSLNQHIRALSERNFGRKIKIPVDDELQELVNNINKMSDKLKTHDQAQKTFLQNASHEFRTPLMSIQSYAEGIKYQVVDPTTASDIIISETKHMTHLVEDLLYLSRLDMLAEDYHLTTLDLQQLLFDCVQRIQRIASKNKVQIVFDQTNDNLEILADEEKLARAFTNILSNCLRYANQTITLSLKQLDDSALQIIIVDDGPGIDKDVLPHIFERFYKGKKGNYGIGLAISQSVIERHNGTIFADNPITGGAQFTILLPTNAKASHTSTFS